MNIYKKLVMAGALVSAASFVYAADEPEIPKCDKTYGSLAIREPENDWWRRYDLENPEALIKYYVNESGCFTMVDRGEGLEMGMSERDLAASGELQVQSNMGGGQLLAADYFLVPDLITDDEDSGGSGLAGAIGGRVGGRVGGLLGGLKSKKLEADTILTLVNSRTGVQELTARGEASKRDISLGLGGLLGVAGGYTSYQDTEIGRVVAVAYATAYTELVEKVKASGGSSSAAPVQSYVMALDTDMYQQPARGDTVRSLRSGMRVFPTGERDGAFLQVKDKFGTEGWVSVEDLQ
ncbi:MAG: hypothetical protein AAGJ86_01785 [Pseudomonadota bacterium]